MTNVLQQSAGRLKIVDYATGAVAMDTDQRLWIQTDWISSALYGAVSLPARSATWAANAAYSGTYRPVDVTNDVAVASVNAAATVVDGMMKVSAATVARQNTYRGGTFSSEQSTFGSTFYNKWFQCSGTVIGDTFVRGITSAVFVSSGEPADSPHFRNAIITYTWIASGGTLTLRERAILGPFNGSGYDTVSHSEITIPARTVDFRLFVGSFV